MPKYLSVENIIINLVILNNNVHYNVWSLKNYEVPTAGKD